MKRLIIVSLLLAQGLWAGEGIPGFYQGSVAQVFENAQKKHQIVMIDFYTAWCGPCKLLEKNIYRNAAFKEITESMVCYTIDAEKGEGVALAEKYNIRAYPSVVFADADGREIERKVGYSDDLGLYLTDLRRIAAGKDVLPKWVEAFAKDSSVESARKIAQYYVSLDSRTAEPYYRRVMQSPDVSDDEKKDLRIRFCLDGLRMGMGGAASEAEILLSGVTGTPDLNEVYIAMLMAQYWVARDKDKGWGIAESWYNRFKSEDQAEVAEMLGDIKYRSGRSTREEDMARIGRMDPDVDHDASQIATIYVKWNEPDKAEKTLLAWLRSNPEADLDALNTTGWTAFEKNIAVKPFAEAMVKAWDVSAPEKQDAYKADTIANLCFANRDRTNAVRFGELAVRMIPERSRMRKEFTENLARYKAMSQ